MPVGLAVSKGEIDARAGDITRGFQRLFGDVLTMKGFLDQTPNADLEALGYTPQDVAVLKTAFGDLFQLTEIFTGNQNLPQPKDFRTFIRQLWGLGAF